ncbi:MAG: deoxynucleoside kinase [Mycoplasmataceae bacterium]|nr:deoxynucleoside kinase [Mycoplasmataceae bacterium]
MKLIISGTTGVGKSTTVNLVKKHYENLGKEVVILSELVIESPFFDLFYQSLEKWSFLGQIEFVLARFKQWIIIEEKYKNSDSNNYVIIYDRFFLEDLIFAELKGVRNAVPNQLSKTYRVIYDELVSKINEYEKPDFFILLRASFDTISERQFKQRGRKQERNDENNINNKFWQDLYYRYYGAKKYRKIFKNYTKNFVEIDTDDNTPKEVLNKVIKYIKRRIS